MKITYFLSLMTILLLAPHIYANDGDLDLNFNVTGKVTTAIGTGHDNAYSVALQSDGKIVVAGDIVASNSDVALVRYNHNGTLDSSFGSDGKVIININIIDYCNAVALQSDGKIIIVGSSYVSANYDMLLIRYNGNGTIDTGFGTDGIVTTAVGTDTDTARSIVIQNDGKILVAGDANSGSESDFALLRYNSNGTLDSTFGTGGIVTTDLGGDNEEGYSVALQSDGKIVVAGTSNNDFAVARYNSNGTLDTSFSTDGKIITDIGNATYDEARGAVIQNDGKIVLIGTSTESIALVRYNADGTLDNTFGTAGTATTLIGSYYSNGYSAALQRDGKIIVAGQSAVYTSTLHHDFLIIRYLHNGTLDNSFGINGIVTTDVGGINHNDEVHSIAIQSNGNIVAAGISDDGSNNNDFALVRYSANPIVIAPIITYILD